MIIQTAVNAIPSFNWPGSKMPPSPLEAIFGGGASKKAAPVPVAPPAPVKKAGLFGSFGKKAEPAAAPAKAAAKPAAKVAAKVAAKPAAKVAAKVVAKPAAKGAVAAKKAPVAAPKKGLFGK